MGARSPSLDFVCLVETQAGPGSHCYAGRTWTMRIRGSTSWADETHVASHQLELLPCAPIRVSMRPDRSIAHSQAFVQPASPGKRIRPAALFNARDGRA